MLRTPLLRLAFAVPVTTAAACLEAPLLPSTGDIALDVDLDGPLLLAKDREPGLVYEGSTLLPPPPALWG